MRSIDISAEEFLTILYMKPLKTWSAKAVTEMTDLIPSEQWVLLPRDIQLQVLNYILH